jgi:hypothetical protein
MIWIHLALAHETYHIEGRGDNFKLVTDRGEEIETPDVLRMMGEYELARQWQQHHNLRKLGAIGLYISPVFAIGTYAYITNGDPSPMIYFIPPLLVGGGLCVQLIDPKRPLGAWIEREQLENFVVSWNNQHSIAQPTLPQTPPNLPETPQPSGNSTPGTTSDYHQRQTTLASWHNWCMGRRPPADHGYPDPAPWRYRNP